jgi:hypothetical protein
MTPACVPLTLTAVSNGRTGPEHHHPEQGTPPSGASGPDLPNTNCAFLLSSTTLMPHLYHQSVPT